jgi:hypothetical protein
MAKGRRGRQISPISNSWIPLGNTSLTIPSSTSIEAAMVPSGPRSNTFSPLPTTSSTSEADTAMVSGPRTRTNSMVTPEEFDRALAAVKQIAEHCDSDSDSDGGAKLPSQPEAVAQAHPSMNFQQPSQAEPGQIANPSPDPFLRLTSQIRRRLPDMLKRRPCCLLKKLNGDDVSEASGEWSGIGNLEPRAIP